MSTENKKAVNFGNGRFSKLAEETYQLIQAVLDYKESLAEKIAKSFVSDLGRLQFQTSGVKIGKIDSDGYIKLTETAKLIKPTKATPAMRLVKIAVEIEKLRGLGLESFKGVKLAEELEAWLKEASKGKEKEDEAVEAVETQPA